MSRRQLLAWVLGLIAVLAPPLVANEMPRQKIAVANGEDLALTADGRWVIASSMPGAGLSEGALYGIDVDSGAVAVLTADQVSEHAGAWAGCPAPEAPQTLSPHGIALQTIEGREILLVVNHGARESVEVYEVVGDDALTLRWLDCLVLPQGAMANAVAATADGRVFVTNMNDDSDTGDDRRWMGNVLVWSAGAGWAPLADSRIYAPNGLLVADDGRTLYVASWAGGEVIRLSADPTMPRAVLALPFLPDNLRWGDGGTLLATGLRGTPEAVVNCVMGPCEQPPLTGVAHIDTATFQASCVRELALAMGTVAVPVGGDLWVGPVRGEAIWVVDGGEGGGIHCRD